METMTQPKITGYRQLTEAEVEQMNEIKAMARHTSLLVDTLRAMDAVDQRWVSIGVTDLQTGFMALTRAVAKPESF